MFPAARITDPITHDMLCPSGVIGPQAPAPCPLCASAIVMIEGLPAAHTLCTCVCTGAITGGLAHPPPPPPTPPPPIIKGSPTVLIHGQMAARWAPSTDIGACGVFLGMPTMTPLRSVLIGDVGVGGAASGVGGGASAPGAGAGAGGGAGTGTAGAASTTQRNGPFDSADEAARAALDVANPQSIRDNLEYSGLIYQGTDGKFYYTGPAQGTDQGADPYGDAPEPEGTTVVGDYHTHGDYSTLDPDTGAAVRTSDPARDDFDSDNFSTDDKLGNDEEGTIGYLGTPSGTYRRYDPNTGEDTEF